MNKWIRVAVVVLFGTTACTVEHDVSSEDDDHGHASTPVDIQDPYLKRWYGLTYDRIPPAPEPGVDYGMDPESGKFRHPIATPASHEMIRFPGELDYWETESYANNMEVVAFYPEIVTPWHSWQAIADFDGRRIMYSHGGGALGIFDISDPTAMTTLARRGTEWTAETGFQWFDAAPPGKEMGASVIRWDERRNGYILVQSFEVPRFTIVDRDKTRQPENVRRARNFDHLKGFRVYAMNGPLQDDWAVLSSTL